MALPPNGPPPKTPPAAELGDTMADAPAIRPPPAPSAGKPSELPPRRPPPVTSPTDSAALEDTAVDADASEAEAAPDVDLNNVYDRPDAVAAADMASLSRYDPEAGRTSVAIKVRAVTQAVRNTVTTPFGKMIVTFPIVLAGISLTIAAITLQDLPYVIAAGLVMPIALLLAYWRYQVWLGHKRYMYRLLESLGEDVTDFDPMRVYRKVGKKMMQKRRP